MFGHLLSYFVITYGALLSIVIRIISCLIILIFCIPLQIQEAQVKNGLRALRIQLVSVGIIIFITNILSMYFLFDVLMSHIPQKLLNSWLQIINAISYFAIAVIGYLMYHQQYSESSKAHHSQVAQIEKMDEAEHAAGALLVTAESQAQHLQDERVKAAQIVDDAAVKAKQKIQKGI